MGRDLPSELGERANPLRALGLKRDRNLDHLALRHGRAGLLKGGDCSPNLPGPLPARLAAPDRQRSS